MFSLSHSFIVLFSVPDTDFFSLTVLLSSVSLFFKSGSDNVLLSFFLAFLPKNIPLPLLFSVFSSDKPSPANELSSFTSSFSSSFSSLSSSLSSLLLPNSPIFLFRIFSRYSSSCSIIARNLSFS